MGTKNVLIKGMPTPKGDEPIKVKKTLQPVKKGEKANMEVEKGEVVVGPFSNDGFPELYVAGGERHSNGGTDINAPDNSFIFSRDKSLKLKNPDIQKSFDKKEKKTGYTFAEIAKQYDINEYRKVLADPDSDKLQRDTAEQMIKNYNEKLGKLSLVQESMKGMPQGVPFIAIPYLESMGINPAEFVHGGNGDEPEVATQQEEDDSAAPQMKFGGGMKVRILKKPIFQIGGEQTSPKTESSTQAGDVDSFIADLKAKKALEIQKQKEYKDQQLAQDAYKKKNLELKELQNKMQQSENKIKVAKDRVTNPPRGFTQDGLIEDLKTADLEHKSNVTNYNKFQEKHTPKNIHPDWVYPVTTPINNIAHQTNSSAANADFNQWVGKTPGVDYIVYNGDTLGVQKKFGGTLDKYQRGGPKRLANGHWAVTNADGSTVEGTVDKAGTFMPLNNKKTTIPNPKNTKGLPKTSGTGMDAYDPQELAVMEQLFPGTAVANSKVPANQSKNKGAGYGTFNKDVADKNWGWYGPVNWDNPQEVKKAGETYNQRVYQKAKDAGHSDKFAQDLVGKIGFDPASGKINSLENKTGEGGLPGGYYGSRVDLNIPDKINPVQNNVQVKSEPENKKYYQTPAINEQVASQNNPFWTQDMVNLAGAFGDNQRIKKYMPWQAGYNVQLPEGIFYDPTRELAANSEQANLADQALTTYSGAQNTSARISDVQGQALESAANILGKYNNMNVTLANQLEGTQKGILNANSANRADQATALFDKTVMTNQNFDNAKAQARQNMRNSFINAWTNRGKTQALNSMNKQYRVNPLTGYVDFTGSPGELGNKDQGANVITTFNELMKNPHFHDEKGKDLAMDLAMKMHGMGSKGVQPGHNIPYDQYSHE